MDWQRRLLRTHRKRPRHRPAQPRDELPPSHPSPLELQCGQPIAAGAACLAFLDNADGDQAQGFFFGRPIPVGDVAARILADFQQQQALKLRAEAKLQQVK